MDGINALIAGVGRPQAKAFDYAEANRNALLQRGGELDLQNAQRDAELRPFKDEMAAIYYLSDIAPMVEYENYPSIRDRLTRMGISQGILPDPNMFEKEGQKYGVTGKDYFNVWKKSAITGLQQQALRVKTAGEGYKPRTRDEWAENQEFTEGLKAENKNQTEEMLTRQALYDPDPMKREQAGQILRQMQTRKIETARAMPAPTVYVGDVGGKPAVTGGTKGSPSLKTLETPGGEPIMPKGSEKLSDAQRKTMDQIGSSKSLVGILKSMWDEIAPQSRLEGTKIYGEAKLGKNPKAKAYMDERKAFLGIISRSLGGEVGVLTDRDIDRVDRALARIGANPLENDTAEEATEKWNTILQIIDEAEQRFVNSLSVKTKSEAIESVGKTPKKIGRFDVKVK